MNENKMETNPYLYRVTLNKNLKLNKIEVMLSLIMCLSSKRSHAFCLNPPLFTILSLPLLSADGQLIIN